MVEFKCSRRKSAAQFAPHSLGALLVGMAQVQALCDVGLREAQVVGDEDNFSRSTAYYCVQPLPAETGRAYTVFASLFS